MESLLPLSRGVGYQPSVRQNDADLRREVMEQASKGSFPHVGGLLLDPLHKKIKFSSVPMDREDRHQRVSAQVESVSGYKKKKKKKKKKFPLPVSCRQTTPEPENYNRIFLTGYYF
jgi:hypothetical protein